MGGGGGYGFSPRDKKHLEESAKKRIQEAGEIKKRNVFISFSHEDMNDVNLLRGQSKNESANLEFADHSVKKPFNSEDSDYIKRQIREKLKNASVTMVYLSEKSMKSKWVKWEIEQSRKMGKGVIGVYKGDKPPANIPTHIKGNVSSITKWQHSDIMGAVNKASEER